MLLVGLLAGVVIEIVPGTRELSLPPELVLVLFLPALLYWESLTTSLREIRANMRVIVLLAVGLVFVTAGLVAALLHTVLDLGWATSFVIGAVVAPTDAAAVAALAYLLPRRQMTILRAESLINDGTALVIYASAVAVATGAQALNWSHLGLELVLSYAGGMAIGSVVGGLVLLIRRRVQDQMRANVLSVATPFLAFLPAERLHVSGVLAVVTAGLLLARYGPRLIPADARVQVYAFWRLVAYLLNAGLFVLLGMQLPSAARGLESHPVGVGLAGVALAGVGVVVGRLLWSYTLPYVIRALDRRPAQRARRVGARQRFAMAWAGVRGGVSMAAALAVPATSVGGARFADRDLIIFVTGGVIVLTLFGQGLSLPWVIRWSRLPTDDEGAELARAYRELLTTAITHLDDPGNIPEGLDEEALADRRGHLAGRLERLSSNGSEASPAGTADETQTTDASTEAKVRLAASLLAAQRRRLLDMRNHGEIDDTIFLTLQEKLDNEEVRQHLRSGLHRGN
jgi:Na+/H+ antiporter